MAGDLEAVRTELADEHRQVMGLVGRLESHRALAGLEALLEELHHTLVDHFAHEQFPGGLYECLGAQEAGAHGELRILVREHCTLLSDVRGLLENAKRAEPADSEMLLGGVAELIAGLRAHERREHRLADSLVEAQSGTGTT